MCSILNVVFVNIYAFLENCKTLYVLTITLCCVENNVGYSTNRLVLLWYFGSDYSTPKYKGKQRWVSCGLSYAFIPSFMFYLATLSNDRAINETQIGMDVKGNVPGITRHTIPAFYWRNWGKPRKASLKIAGLHGEIWSRNPSNMKQQC
jgi:hypothetical protein